MLLLLTVIVIDMLNVDSQTDSVKKYRIRLSVVKSIRSPLARNDSQTDSVKKYKIRLSVVKPVRCPLSAVRWLGTALEGQTGRATDPS
jgi:hypothetical protein